MSGKVFNEEGMPNEGPGWDEIEFPDFGQEKVFALEVTGDCHGARSIATATCSSSRRPPAPARATASSCAPRAGEILAKELKRRSAKTLEMTSLAKDQEDQVIPSEEIAWVARIMWARQ